MQHLDKIKKCFTPHAEWVEPYWTTEEAIVSGKSGMHRGLYWIAPEMNFYFGKAATSFVHARNKTHWMKLNVDLRTLYGGDGVSSKKEAGDKFPVGWKQAMCDLILEGVKIIPSHYIQHGTGKNKYVTPGVLDFPVKYKVNVAKLPVLVWDLDHLTSKQISNIEKSIIKDVEPYANTETYRKRTKMQKKVDIS